MTKPKRFRKVVEWKDISLPIFFSLFYVFGYIGGLGRLVLPPIALTLFFIWVIYCSRKVTYEEIK